jgi:3-oxoacyl-[acyl-carrier-protein] synthase II
MPPQSGMDAVVVTGLGQVAPHGDDPRGAFDALVRGHSAITRWADADAAPAAVGIAAFDPSSHFTKLQLSGVDRVSQLAVAAASGAWADAGIRPDTIEPERIGVYVGCGMGGASAIEQAFVSFDHIGRVPPLTVPAFMPNAPAAHVAMRLQARGPVLTYSVACSSSAVAIAEATRAVATGAVDIALAGGAEALLVPSVIRAWQALNTLASPDPERPASSCRPFSRDRSGFVLAEAAAFLVLERATDAAARGARAYARIAGSATACDATHLTKPDRAGQRRALTAAKLGDLIECEALREVWGDAIGELRVSSTKAMHGHTLGAAGALEALVTVLALDERRVPPNAHCRDPDPACAVRLVVEGEDMPDLRYAVSSSFAFGGTNQVLVFGRAD